MCAENNLLNVVFTKHITDSRILCFCVISHQLCYYRMSIKKQLKIQTREFEPERMIPSKAAEKG